MTARIPTALLTAALLTACASEPTPTLHAEPGILAKAPLRNDVMAVLDAPIDQVWAVVGDHSQLSSYSVGIAEVTLHGACEGASGGVDCTRTCSFHDGPPLDERIVFVDGPHALGTSAVEPNDYLLTNDLTFVTLRALDDGQTEFWWRQYYDHPEVAAMGPVFDEALADIAQRLVDRFGGTVGG